MQHYPRSKTSSFDTWREDIRPELIAPVEAAANDDCYEAIDLLTIYYLCLQLRRRATRSGTPAAVRSTEGDVAAAENLLRRFAARGASQTKPPHNSATPFGNEPAPLHEPQTSPPPLDRDHVRPFERWRRLVC